MNDTAELVLDFSIPQGPTGPMGPNPPMCYIDYNTSNNANKLSIKDSKIFHSNGDFTVNGNALTITPGTYEVTFCGKIEINGSFQSTILVALQESLGGAFSQPIEGMTISLPPGTSCMHFSETRVISFNDIENIKVIITNHNASPVTVSMGSLTMKKII